MALSNAPHSVKEGESTSSAPATSNAPPFVKGGLGGISEKEQPFELPQDWEWTLLGEITNFGTTEKLDLISDDTWVLDLEDIEKDTSKLLQKFRFSERRSLSTKNSFLAGDVLYGKLRPYLNKVIVADEDGVCTTEILPFRCYGPFSNNYFKFALKSPYFISYVNARSYGMKMPRLGTDDGRKAYFPLPPLAEQHRIVAKVDELMALCDQLENQHSNAAEAHEKLVSYLLDTLTQSPKTGSPLCKRGAGGDFDWQRIAAHFNTLFTTETSIDALKQTLLQLAVMGKLVPQDPNDEPASESLKRIQAEKAKLIAEGKIKKAKPLTSITDEEKPFYLPSGWNWVRFSDYATDISTGPFGSMIHQSDYIQGGVPLINPSHMIDDKIFSDETVSVSKIMAKTLDSYAIYEGDIVMARRGEVGRIALVTENENGWLCGTGSFVLRFYSEVCRNYLRIFFRCNYARTYLAGEAVGTTMVNLNHGILKKMPLALPSPAEQQRIVAKVDELMVICDQLKSRLTEANQLQQKLADVLVEQATNHIKKNQGIKS